VIWSSENTLARRVVRHHLLQENIETVPFQRGDGNDLGKIVQLCGTPRLSGVAATYRAQSQLCFRTRKARGARLLQHVERELIARIKLTGNIHDHKSTRSQPSMASRTSTIILRPDCCRACARPVYRPVRSDHRLGPCSWARGQRLDAVARGLRLGRNDSDLLRPLVH